MSKAKITMIGLYHFHDGLFDQLELPDGVDAETVQMTILDKAADFEVIYGDPFFTENMIGLISKKWARTFQKWYDALQIEYAPLENYDRYEHWTDDGTNTGTVKDEGKTHGESTSDGQSDEYVTTYDSDTLHLDRESKDHSEATSDGTTGNTNTRDLKDNSIHDGRMHGNIGVTTSQQMLEAELKIDEWNLYEHIADIYVRELCIMVY